MKSIWVTIKMIKEGILLLDPSSINIALALPQEVGDADTDFQAGVRVSQDVPSSETGFNAH
jgi:hypothetical protein